MKDVPFPFSQRRYELPSCAFTSLEERYSGAISCTLATMEPWRTLGYHPEHFSSYLTRMDPGLSRFAVEVSDKTVGVFCVRFPWLMGSFLELIALYGDYQGRGIGREIIKWLEGETRISSKNLWTTVSSFNSRARRFYHSAGFEEIGVLKDLVKPGFEEVLLRKQLL